jgi:hypothetical protein
MMILENLRKAGVQNTFKNERLTFDRLEPDAGAWIHATGEFTNGDGKTRRVAVTIGPEYGTVTPQQVKEAAKEAVSGVGFDILIVCRLRLRPARLRGSQALRQAHGFSGTDEPRRFDWRGTEEHRLRQPVHGLR